MRTVNFIINGIEFKGGLEPVIRAIEAYGYRAKSENKNPHEFWQYSEHLKKDRDRKPR